MAIAHSWASEIDETISFDAAAEIASDIFWTTIWMHVVVVDV